MNASRILLVSLLMLTTFWGKPIWAQDTSNSGSRSDATPVGSTTANVKVPNVVGQTEAAAATAITKAGLVVGTVTSQSSATVAAGLVISESPIAGTSVAPKSAVNLAVSSGPAKVKVPNVVGQTEAAAATAITKAGLVVGTVTSQSSATVAAGLVISESPIAGTSVAPKSAVNLAVSSGPAKVKVPNVVGQTEAAAATAITKAGLVVGTVTSQSSATVAAGLVISESPIAGTSVAPKSAVNLAVSSGPAKVKVPNVVGQTEAAAATAITKAGLVVGTVTSQSSATVAAGLVISESPIAGTSVAPKSAVNLAVSSGPAKVKVPNVVGDTQAAATTAITGAGLIVGPVTKQSSGTVALGRVISENPAAGSTVAQASSVALVISSGPAQAFSVGGIVIGLGASATVDVLNGTDNVAISANGAFTFPTAVASGGNYSVTVGTPTSAQTCAVQNASGTITSADVTNIAVYCTYNVSTATLHQTFTGVGADFQAPYSGYFYSTDENDAATFDGMGNVSASATVNTDGGIVNTNSSGTYEVTTTNAVPDLTTLLTTVPPNIASGSGGIEGLNGDANVVVGTISGTPPAIIISVLPNANATTDSINGNYTLVDLSTQLTTGSIYGYEATIDLTNGTITGSYTENLAGTITTGNPLSGQWTVTAGIITAVGSGSGAVSADGDLIVLADTTFFDDPHIAVAVPLGTGVTEASFEGVYSVVEYTGSVVAATTGSQITLFAYGNGTYSEIATENNNGTITANKTDTGTYTVAANGTLALTGSKGDVHNGAISPDGNALVLGNITSGQEPAILVGVRQ